MNTATHEAARTTIDGEALAWIAIVLTAVAVLVGGALHVRAVNAAQMEAAGGSQQQDDPR